jgi:hypothetical protein
MTIGAEPGVMAVRVLSVREMIIELLSSGCGRSLDRGRSDARGDEASGEVERAVEADGTGRDSAKDPSLSQVPSPVDGEVIPHAFSRPSRLRMPLV